MKPIGDTSKAMRTALNPKSHITTPQCVELPAP